ncbi:MAG: hypothetical protein V3U72_01135 [Candidatus Aenigmarchaeota archaeon]
MAERISMNPNYMPNRDHAATLYGQLKHLSPNYSKYKTVKDAFLRAGGKEIEGRLILEKVEKPEQSAREFVMNEPVLVTHEPPSRGRYHKSGRYV